MEHLEAELAKARRDLRNWRRLAAVAVLLATVVVLMAVVPYAMN